MGFPSAGNGPARQAHRFGLKRGRRIDVDQSAGPRSEATA